ncbi:MAG: MFS transporter [Nitrososphaerota archaeon]|nr:MFS transporter [Nitrososphaerota archaeon]
MHKMTEQHAATKQTSHVRWAITSLLTLAIAVNYIDRIIWVIAEPKFSQTFGWYSGTGPLTPLALKNIALILFIWSMAYAFFNFPGGWIVDKLGIRKGMATFFTIWSAFTVATAATFNFVSMAVVRAIMGAGEGPVWPINGKNARTWSHPNEESTMFTLAGSGQAVGPIIAAVVGAFQVTYWGWQTTFVFWGVVGLLFAAVWYFFVRDSPQQHPGISQNEMNYIQSGRGDAKGDTGPRLSSKDTWKITLKLAFTTRAGIGELLIFVSFAYILGAILSWVPTYFYTSFLHNVTSTGLYSGAVYASLLGGYLASGPINDGLSKRMGRASGRRVAALVPMALMIVFVAISYYTGVAGQIVPTAILLALAGGVMNITVGSWATNAITISPGETSATVYGFFNGILNIMGAFTSLIIVSLALAYGFPAAITSTIFFMVLFILAYTVFITQKSMDHAIEKGNAMLAAAKSHSQY